MRFQQLTLQPLTWSAHQVVMRFLLDDLEFTTSYWYPDIHLLALERRFGRPFLERLLVHAALFECNKLASLRVERLSLGVYAHHHTQALEQLWTTIFDKVWAQWRYENQLPFEKAPRFASTPVDEVPLPMVRDLHADEVLLFCGGGKDSLVSMKLLERAGIPFASFAYTSSVYGPAAFQFQLLEGLLREGIPRQRHRMTVQDDLFDAPVLELFGPTHGVQTITAAETPSSIFAVLPILLSRGYAHAILGNEASANRGNLIWPITGEEVNHQWGKSVEAEGLLDRYIREHLVADIGIFSVLMPLHDVLIFELLRQDEGSLHATHSCNVAKPWCRRCAKCAYVWLNCRAHLSEAPVQNLFREDLLEVPENQHFFRDMMGLGVHTPFECIGQIEESRLALHLCGARGLLGPFGRSLLASLPPIPLQEVLDRFTQVHAVQARLPESYAAPLLKQMDAAALRARARIQAVLAHDTSALEVQRMASPNAGAEHLVAPVEESNTGVNGHD